MIKEELCNYCNEASKFGGRVNGGKNYYCLKCIKKINDSKIDYWKECSFDEFLESIPTKNRKDSETPFADHIREELRKAGVDVPERKQRKKSNAKRIF